MQHLQPSLWRGLICAVLICGLSGCFFSGGAPACEKPQEFQSASSIEPLRVPDGLDQPDRSESLDIPQVSANAKHREKGDPCLENPPDYFGR
jgi:uncharacterized lipoprotein